ncbi:unnamed protein product [Fusarium graminearum]|uniref:Chromosome 1, complete genome n=1 Tax=Gibberella zeae (strain ATCC MYA-4620 / CBS 123657 / FGSC 9075 / NRRL 31084 / PH-1) TaxID=229533 RepID=A0A098D212_GIBZE|nr:unnamed protein product [Fusarium graminearum]
MFVAIVAILQINVTYANPARPITLHHLSLNHRNYLVLMYFIKASAVDKIVGPRPREPGIKIPKAR